MDKTIAQQGGQISEMAREMEAMKKMMVQAGLNPDLAVAASRAVQGAPV